MWDWTKSTLAERLEHVRQLNGGISQNKLGMEAGIKGGPMSKLVNSPRPSGAKLAAIAKAWNVDLLWLAAGQGEPRASASTSKLPEPLARVLKQQPERWPEFAVSQALLIPESHLLAEAEWVDYLDALRREARRISLEARETREATKRNSEPKFGERIGIETKTPRKKLDTPS